MQEEVMATAATTAIEAWDRRWATSRCRADWLDPKPDVIALVPQLKARGPAPLSRNHRHRRVYRALGGGKMRRGRARACLREPSASDAEAGAVPGSLLGGGESGEVRRRLQRQTRVA